MDCQIQVLGYRTGRDRDTGKEFVYQKLFATVSSAHTLFHRIDDIIASIPENERWNVHYTTANCVPQNKDKGIPLREFAYQEIIAFDLDGIDLKYTEKYIKIMENVLGHDKDRTGIVCSGNGLHFIILTTYKIADLPELKRLQPYYKALCGEINARIFEAGLPGNADPVRFAEAATMRLPNTKNVKKDKEDTYATFIKAGVEFQDYDLASKAILVKDSDTAEVKFNVDTPAVIEGCEFLKHCLASPNQITEPQWYAMIGTLAFIPEVGRELCHTYSKGHDDYDYEVTEAKINQAESFAKPRTCASIEQLWSGCRGCPNFGKCKTPLGIKGEDYIGTKNTGFHNIIKDDFGLPKKFVPNYVDLQKYFSKLHPYVTISDSATVMVYKDNYWQEMLDLEIEGFATANFSPTANNHMRNEFKGIVKSQRHVREEEFESNTVGFINFRNGIYDIGNNVLLPHDMKFGFTYILPYDYNPHATCETFNSFMKSITVDRADLEQTLLEFIGYAISGRRASWGEKSLFLVGEGSNGKSTFLNCIRDLVGKNCYSSVPLKSFHDPNSISQMENKLFNVVEEVDYHSLLRASEEFKAITTGGTCEVKKLYKNRRSTVINCKLIFACNKLPPTNDYSNGVFRRLLIVPFDAEFSEAEADKNLREKLMIEMSGIYNKVIEAYRVLNANGGRFTQAEASVQALEEYRRDVDIVAQWYDSNVMLCSQGSFVSHEELMADFQQWREQNRYHKIDLSMIAFTKRFRTIIRVKEAEIRKIGVRAVRGYTGYRLVNRPPVQSDM